MPPGIRKSICIKVEVSCPYIANKLFWNFNIGTLEPMTCIASSLGFSLVSNQKNLRVVSRLIWKKRQENTQEYFYSSNRLQEGESQWLCWLFTDLLFSFSNLYDVPQVDAGRDQQRAPVFTHWNLGFQNLSVEKRALQIRCWNVKYLKTRTSLDMHRHVKTAEFEFEIELPWVDWVALSCVLLLLHRCCICLFVCLFFALVCLVRALHWYCRSDPEWKSGIGWVKMQTACGQVVAHGNIKSSFWS